MAEESSKRPSMMTSSFFLKILETVENPIYYDRLRGYISESPVEIKNYVRKKCRGEDLLTFFKRRKKHFYVDSDDCVGSQLKPKKKKKVIQLEDDLASDTCSDKSKQNKAHCRKKARKLSEPGNTSNLYQFPTRQRLFSHNARSEHILPDVLNFELPEQSVWGEQKSEMELENETIEYFKNFFDHSVRSYSEIKYLTLPYNVKAYLKLKYPTDKILRFLLDHYSIFSVDNDGNVGILHSETSDDCSFEESEACGDSSIISSIISVENESEISRETDALSEDSFCDDDSGFPKDLKSQLSPKEIPLSENVMLRECNMKTNDLNYISNIRQLTAENEQLPCNISSKCSSIVSDENKDPFYSKPESNKNISETALDSMSNNESEELITIDKQDINHASENIVQSHSKSAVSVANFPFTQFMESKTISEINRYSSDTELLTLIHFVQILEKRGKGVTMLIERIRGHLAQAPKEVNSHVRKVYKGNLFKKFFTGYPKIFFVKKNEVKLTEKYFLHVVELVNSILTGLQEMAETAVLDNDESNALPMLQSQTEQRVDQFETEESRDGFDDDTVSSESSSILYSESGKIIIFDEKDVTSQFEIEESQDLDNGTVSSECSAIINLGTVFDKLNAKDSLCHNLENDNHEDPVSFCSVSTSVIPEIPNPAEDESYKVENLELDSSSTTSLDSCKRTISLDENLQTNAYVFDNRVDDKFKKINTTIYDRDCDDSEQEEILEDFPTFYCRFVCMYIVNELALDHNSSSESLLGCTDKLCSGNPKSDDNFVTQNVNQIQLENLSSRNGTAEDLPVETPDCDQLQKIEIVYDCPALSGKSASSEISDFFSHGESSVFVENKIANAEISEFGKQNVAEFIPDLDFSFEKECGVDNQVKPDEMSMDLSVEVDFECQGQLNSEIMSTDVDFVEVSMSQELTLNQDLSRTVCTSVDEIIVPEHSDVLEKEIKSQFDSTSIVLPTCTDYASTEEVVDESPKLECFLQYAAESNNNSTSLESEEKGNYAEHTYTKNDSTVWVNFNKNIEPECSAQLPVRSNIVSVLQKHDDECDDVKCADENGSAVLEDSCKNIDCSMCPPVESNSISTSQEYEIGYNGDIEFTKDNLEMLEGLSENTEKECATKIPLESDVISISKKHEGESDDDDKSSTEEDYMLAMEDSNKSKEYPVPFPVERDIICVPEELRDTHDDLNEDYVTTLEDLNKNVEPNCSVERGNVHNTSKVIEDDCYGNGKFHSSVLNVIENIPPKNDFSLSPINEATVIESDESSSSTINEDDDDKTVIGDISPIEHCDLTLLEREVKFEDNHLTKEVNVPHLSPSCSKNGDDGIVPSSSCHQTSSCYLTNNESGTVFQHNSDLNISCPTENEIQMSNLGMINLYAYVELLTKDSCIAQTTNGKLIYCFKNSFYCRDHKHKQCNCFSDLAIGDAVICTIMPPSSSSVVIIACQFSITDDTEAQNEQEVDILNVPKTENWDAEVQTHIDVISTACQTISTGPIFHTKCLVGEDLM